jgi:uncharacterized protein (DUF58 family)
MFGTVHSTKRDLITELAAVIAFSAVNNNDKVGVIFYSDLIEKYIPPKKGKQHALFIVRELLSMEPKGKGTTMSKALRFFSNSTRQKSIAFVLSDMLDENYSDALRIASRKHDVIGLKIYDRMDKDLPEMGLVQVQDAESGKRKWVDTSSPYVRYDHEQQFFRLTEQAVQNFKTAGSDLLHIRTGDDYVKVLQRFFLSRNR